jgi:mannitol-1-phosphate/altronate dehydrogenase
MKTILQEKALLSHQDNLAFLRIESIFGDLINSRQFTEAYADSLRCIYQKGIIACVNSALEQKQ